MAEATKAKEGIKKSITQYVLEERMRECVVCALPAEVREQFRIARKKKMSRETMLAYVRDVYGVDIDDDAFTAHGAGAHERKLKELNGSG